MAVFQVTVSYDGPPGAPVPDNLAGTREVPFLTLTSVMTGAADNPNAVFGSLAAALARRDIAWAGVRDVRLVRVEEL